MMMMIEQSFQALSATNMLRSLLASHAWPAVIFCFSLHHGQDFICWDWYEMAL